MSILSRTIRDEQAAPTGKYTFPSYVLQLVQPALERLVSPVNFIQSSVIIITAGGRRRFPEMGTREGVAAATASGF